MKKIIIIGTTGSGKSTFAKNLEEKLKYPLIQLDNLFWKPNWEWPSNEEFYQKIRDAIDCESWIVDGNYTRTQSITWIEADTVIWLDLPLWLTFYQSFVRSFKRAITKEELWKGTGNRESFGRMFSKDSILLWLLKTYRLNRLKYEAVMADPLFDHITFYRFNSRKQMYKFILGINKEI